MKSCAYLDIETTGLSPFTDDLTVIGIFRDDNGSDDIVQVIGDDIDADRILEALQDIDVVYTYNGSRFDLPFIKEKLSLDVTELCSHTDLMSECWRRKLYGGLKGVERKLGISRNLPDVNGWVAVQLWFDYKLNSSKDSLRTLLEYNKEDVMNLKLLREELQV